MALEVGTKEVNDVVVFDLIGNLDTNTAPDAETSINNYLESGAKKMVINLGANQICKQCWFKSIFLQPLKK